MSRLLLILIALSQPAFAQSLTAKDVAKRLQAPVGFKISVFADKVPNARTLALGDNGVVYVGTVQEGNVYALQDQDGDGIAERKYTLATGLYMPNGVAYKDGALYVAEVNRILRFDNITQHLQQPPKPVVIYEQLPSEKHHGWKYLRFGQDGKLYTAVGAPCNICEPSKAIYGTLIRLNPDGSNLEILARGIRNSEGFDWQPETHQLFFTENGRDYLGDDLPPDELNLWTQKGQHFGYPYCHGGTLLDPEWGKHKNCADFVAPAWRFKAHNAPLGMRFYTGTQFPKSYQQQLFVAQHGSWNRSQPDGYRIALVHFHNHQPTQESVFISGWLQPNGEALGRPVDILQLPNGSLLISDDTLGAIYKVEYQP